MTFLQEKETDMTMHPNKPDVHREWVRIPTYKTKSFFVLVFIASSTKIVIHSIAKKIYKSAQTYCKSTPFNLGHPPQQP